MDTDTRPTTLVPAFNPLAAWEAARASAALYWQERRRADEARRLQALSSYDDQSDADVSERPTIPAPAADR